MNTNLLPYLLCTECRSDQLELTVDHSREDQVELGFMTCGSCGTWYRIENGIADLLPLPLGDTKRRELFARGRGLTFKPVARKISQEQKIAQIRFFARDTEKYEEGVTNGPCFGAVEDVYFRDWIERNLDGDSRILDLGCGTGRPLLLMAERGIRVIGIDISEEMLLVAQDKIGTAECRSRADLILADAEQLPLKDEAFDGCVMAGTLHHFSRPLAALQQAAVKVRMGGVFFSCDPHKSPARFIFDWVMKVWKLWPEEANENPLFSEQQLATLYQNAGLEVRTRLSTFVLPHVFCFLRPQINARLLRITDTVLGAIPLVRKLAGQIIAEGVRVRSVQTRQLY